MKKKFGLLSVYLPIFLIFLPLITAMRSVALINHLGNDGIYFDEKLLINTASIMLALLSLFYISYLFTANKSVKLIPSFATPSSFVATAISILAVVFMSINMTFGAVGAYKLMAQGEVSRTTSTVAVVATLVAVFGFLSTAHLTLTALSEKVSNALRANFAMATVLFLAGYSVYLYLDKSVPMNTPAKSIDMIAYLSASLFFLYETRLSMGRAKWRGYIAFGLIAATFCAYSSVPALILYFTKGVLVSNNIYDPVLAFALFVFITARILLTVKLIEDKESPIVSALSLLAEKRAQEIEAHNKEFEEKQLENLENRDEIPDENQFTIDELLPADITDDSKNEVLTDEENTCN